MWRKSDRQQQDMESIVQRLRDERPEASGLELDRVKTTAMRKARSTGSGARFRSRRLAVIGLTLGLSAAGTGGVLAAGGASPSSGSAAKAQYSTTTSTETSTTVFTSTFTETGTTFTSFSTSTVTAAVTATVSATSTSTVTSATTTTSHGGVLGANEAKAATSSRKVKLHFTADPGAKFQKVKIRLDGRLMADLKGNVRSYLLKFAYVPCSSKTAVVVLRGELSPDHWVIQTFTYPAC
jgi:hypothetical protein